MANIVRGIGWPTAALIVCLLLLLQGTVCAKPFYVSGDLVYIIHPNASNPKETHYVFTATVDGERWKIRTTPKVCTGIMYHEIAFDGEERRELTQFEVADKPEKWNSAVGLVDLNPAPSNPLLHADSLWLAYASSGYLKNDKTGKLPPIWHRSRKSDSSYFVPAEWTLSDTAPFLLTELRACLKIHNSRGITPIGGLEYVS